ncbi:MAG: hypothetical protein ABEL51_15705 [Salinibacter sp.]
MQLYRVEYHEVIARPMVALVKAEDRLDAPKAVGASDHGEPGAEEVIGEPVYSGGECQILEISGDRVEELTLNEATYMAKRYPMMLVDDQELIEETQEEG